MNKILLGFIFANIFSLAVAQNSDNVTKQYKWKFYAGAANGLNFFEEQDLDNNLNYKKSYKKWALGNGLGAELHYILPKKFELSANYYSYTYKNKITENTSLNYPIYVFPFSLKQITQNLTLGANYTFFDKNNSSIYSGISIGMQIEDKQLLSYTYSDDGYFIQFGEQKSFKFLMPITIGTSRIIKEHFILGANAQLFLVGDSKPIRSINLFSYLGVRF